MSHQSAYILVFHGSRDPRPQQAVTQLAGQIHHRLGKDTLPIATAALELAPDPLHHQIESFVRSVLIPAGCPVLRIMPLFLSPGVHVMDDVPREVAIAQQYLHGHPGCPEMQLYPYLGQHPRMPHLVHQMLPTPLNSTATVVVAHGTRRVGGNVMVEAIAATLQAEVAYWVIEPDLTTQVQRLMAQGHRQITVVPYFLFPGGTVDAIAAILAEQMQQQPEVRFHLADPLGASPHCVDAVMEMFQTDPMSVHEFQSVHQGQSQAMPVGYD